LAGRVGSCCRTWQDETVVMRGIRSPQEEENCRRRKAACARRGLVSAGWAAKVRLRSPRAGGGRDRAVAWTPARRRVVWSVLADHVRSQVRRALAP